MKFIQLLIICIQIFFTISSNDYTAALNSDFSKCFSTPKTSCKNTALSDKNVECCKVSTQYYGSTYSNALNNYEIDFCSLYTTIKISKDDIKAMERVYRESVGFTYTMIGEDYLDYAVSFKQTFDCSSQTFTIDYNTGSYTNEEKEVFKKSNYCLRLYYQGLMDLEDNTNYNYAKLLNLESKTITKSDCENAVILPSSKDYATCAYASFNFKLSNGSTKNIQTCLYISKNAFKTEALDQHLQSSFSSYSSINGYTINSYEIEITDQNNNKLTYDSKTQKLTSTSKGSFARLPKIISIILILSLF